MKVICPAVAGQSNVFGLVQLLSYVTLSCLDNLRHMTNYGRTYGLT